MQICIEFHDGLSKDVLWKSVLEAVLDDDDDDDDVGSGGGADGVGIGADGCKPGGGRA